MNSPQKIDRADSDPGQEESSMKVVLFCGGLGMRLRDYSDTIPKPMVHIGYRPILWHVMKYYAHYGHKDFILCLGYKADMIKEYFLNYNECLSNDFVLAKGGTQIQLLNRDIDDWRITFVDTGIPSNIGQRLKLVEPYLEGEEIFLANYTDGVTDLPFPEYLHYFFTRKKLASFLCVRPNQTFHVVSLQSDIVTGLEDVRRADIWLNGGFFIFHRDIFSYLQEGEDLVEKPFRRLIKAQQLLAYQYKGFWACMDTFKDKQQLEDLHLRGQAPWEVWKSLTTTNGSLAYA
jgi:glucose-1-phosphate cytidylyltransferase